MIKKYLLPAVFILMTVSLAGIIFIQYMWFKNAYEVKESQFDQSVNKALSEVIHRLSRDQDVHFVSSQIWVDDDDDSTNVNESETVVWKDNDNEITHSYVYVDDGKKQVKKISVSGGNNGNVFTIDALGDTNFRIKTYLKLDSIRDELDENQLIVLTEFTDSMDVIVQKKMHEITLKKQSLNKVIDDMSVEIESYGESLDLSFTPEQIEERVSDALSDKGIELPFEFGVYLPEKDSVTELRSASFSVNDASYKVNMFPERIFKRPELLMVSFPNRKAHILQSMGMLLSGSFIFTLIIILTFFIAIRIILRQKRLSEIKSDFINNMTHEFKTPIATISLAVDSINNQRVISDPERIRYFTNIIGEENQRMNSRVENVLQMSLIDKNDFNLVMEEINMHDLINNAISNIDLQLKKQEGTITSNYQANNPVFKGDAVHLTNIVMNLLDNAIKYSTEPPQLKISTFDSDSQFSFTLEDKGIGMTREEQQKIFDKFFRVSKGDIHNVKGFGLGLSYVKAIVLAMHGDISLKSRPGEGTTFKVTFPKEKLV